MASPTFFYNHYSINLLYCQFEGARLSVGRYKRKKDSRSYPFFVGARDSSVRKGERISPFLLSSVRHGSNDRSGRYSPPWRFKSRLFSRYKQKRIAKAILFCWCERRDLNPYGESTRPSNVRVCQFRHSRGRLILYLFPCSLSSPFLKKHRFFSSFI